MHIVTLESCHGTRILDARQLRFCRILKGIAVGQRRISTASSIPTQECVPCGGYHTAELSLEDIRRAAA